MAIAMIVEFKGGGMDKYNAVMKELGLDQPNAQWPRGIVSHVTGPISNGFCAIDVWESQEAWDTFLSQKLAPAINKVGGIPKPEPKVFPVQNAHGLNLHVTR